MIANLAAGVQAFTSNAFLVDGERPVVVDAGANFDAVSAIEERVGGLDAIVLTHTHPDHVGNVDDVREAFDAPVWGYDPEHEPVERAIVDGETVPLGDHEYVALHTPGHADDHLCFYADGPGVLFSGDLIFQNGAYGRTDLEGGDRTALVESIDRVHERVDESLEELHPGHGPSVTSDAVRHVDLARQTSRF